MIIPIYITYSPTYPSVETDALLLRMALTVLLGEAMTLLSKL